MIETHAATRRTTAALRAAAYPGEDGAALNLALDDLRQYWEQTHGPATFCSLAPGEEAASCDLLILVGDAAHLPEIAALERAGALPVATARPESYTLDTLTTAGRRLAVVRAWDRLGLQYSVYGLAERLLGVRYLHPFHDLLPAQPPAWTETHEEAVPDMAVRIFYETSHTADDLRATTRKSSHYSDVGGWRWEDWAGNSTRAGKLVDWAVKNRANVLFFDDTLFIQIRRNKVFVASDDLWHYLDLRGLKTFMYLGPSWGHKPEDGVTDEDICTHDAPRVQWWQRHPCIGKPGFWRDQERWLDLIQPHAQRLIGLATNWNEIPCCEGAYELLPDGSAHEPSGDPAHPLHHPQGKLVVSSGAGCATCGHMTNAEKWALLLDRLNGPDGVARRGLPPVGHMRTFWYVPLPDDALVAEVTVPHIPLHTLNPIYCLPNANHAERVEAWPRLVDAQNARDGGDRRVFLVRELDYGCHGDMPLTHATSLDNIDHDHAVFGKYACTATVCGGSYVMHSLGWLLVYYSMRKQWDTSGEWLERVDRELAGLLGAEAAEAFLAAAQAVKSVQMYEDTEVGEVCGYYSWWGLNLGRYAPESAIAGAPLQASTFNAHGKRFVRLVPPGTRDSAGLYTAAACAPARAAVLRLLAKLEEAERENTRFEDLAAAQAQRAFWLEHAVTPTRLTIAFLRTRLYVALACCTYVAARERSLSGCAAEALLEEAAEQVRAALLSQDLYSRLKPGFAEDYPNEVQPATLQALRATLLACRAEPARMRVLDVCALLDDAENLA
ncbi:MAG: hypothetical protein GX557_12600 [Chloroflexi bacterium]|nr:hypothetical protein [Chloroflexota bacterium]